MIFSLPACFDVADWRGEAFLGELWPKLSSSFSFIVVPKIVYGRISCHQLAVEYHRREPSLAAVCTDAKYTKNVAIFKGSFCKKTRKAFHKKSFNPQP